MERLLSACGDRGVLVITHELAALDGFDRVLGLRDGKLSAAASPAPMPAAA
jgi:ABC-type transport system involved in cytochrome bd biosynthesis fused ATPase/permease subunit